MRSIELLMALLELAHVRRRRLRVTQRFGEPKRAKLLSLYEELEANHLEQVEILLSLRQN